MKFIYFNVLALFFTFISSAFAETVTIVGDPWCPYNCEPGEDKPGFMIEVAQEIFKENGIDVVYKVVPWTRAIDEVRKGKYNATVGGYIDDTPDFIFPEHAMAKSVDAFYIKQDGPLDWSYKGVSSLETVSIGVIRDYSYGAIVDQYISDHKKDSSRIQFASGDNALEQNVKKLLAGRIQVVVEDGDVMQRFLTASNQKDKIKMVGHDEGENVYIAFSPNEAHSKQYAEMLSEGIARYEQSGRLQAIKAKYDVK